MLKPKYLALVISAAAILSLGVVSCKSTPEDDSGSGTENMVLDYAESNASKLALVDEAREAAVKAGAEKVAQSAFNAAEAEYLAVKASSADPATDITAAADDLIARYTGLEAFANAKEKKSFIDKNSYASYDQTDYDTATVILDDLTKNIAVLGADFNEKAVEADLKYSLVIATAFKKVANDERAAAIAAKKDADAVKVGVSRKDDYKAAVELLNKGDSNYATGGVEASIQNYRDAKNAFTTLTAEVTKAKGIGVKGQLNINGKTVASVDASANVKGHAKGEISKKGIDAQASVIANAQAKGKFGHTHLSFAIKAGLHFHISFSFKTGLHFSIHGYIHAYAHYSNDKTGKSKDIKLFLSPRTKQSYIISKKMIIYEKKSIKNSCKGKILGQIFRPSIKKY